MLFYWSLSQEKWNQFWSPWANLQGKCDFFSGTTVPQGANEGVQPSFILAHVLGNTVRGQGK